jgi:hypothetical protein
MNPLSKKSSLYMKENEEQSDDFRSACCKGNHKSPHPPFSKGGMGGFVVTIDLTAYSVQLHWCGGNRGK